MWETDAGARDLQQILFGKPKYTIYICLELENDVDIYRYIIPVEKV